MPPREPREAKAPKAQTPEEPQEGVGITYDEMVSAYESQIGSMATQIIQKDLIIQKLQDELTKKRG